MSSPHSVSPLERPVRTPSSPPKGSSSSPVYGNSKGSSSPSSPQRSPSKKRAVSPMFRTKYGEGTRSLSLSAFNDQNDSLSSSSSSSSLTSLTSPSPHSSPPPHLPASSAMSSPLESNFTMFSQTSPALHSGKKEKKGLLKKAKYSVSDKNDLPRRGTAGSTSSITRTPTFLSPTDQLHQSLPSPSSSPPLSPNLPSIPPPTTSPSPSEASFLSSLLRRRLFQKKNGYFWAGGGQDAQNSAEVGQYFVRCLSPHITHYCQLVKKKGEKEARNHFGKEKFKKEVVGDLVGFFNVVLELLGGEGVGGEKEERKLGEVWGGLGGKRWVEVMRRISFFLQNTFLRREIDALKNLFLIAFPGGRGGGDGGEREGVYAMMVKDFLDFCGSRPFDSANFLVGLHPSQNVLSALCPMQEALPTTTEEEGDSRTTREDLIQSIFRWEEISSFEVLQQEVLFLAQKLRMEQPCLPGNMVVVKILALEQFSEDFSRLAPGNKSTNNVDIDSFDPFSVVFCRVVSVSSEFIEVTLDPLEVSKCVSVPISDVFFFKWSNFKPLHPMSNNLSSWVTNPLCGLYADISQIMSEEIVQIIGRMYNPESIGILRKAREVFNALKQNKDQDVLFSHEPLNSFFEVTSLYDSLNSFVDSFSASSASSLLTQKAWDYCEKWVEEIAPNLIFVFSVDDSLTQFQQFCERIQRMALLESKNIRRAVEIYLHYLHTRIVEIVEEKRKSELTSWWLTYSEKRVEAFLKELGYIFEVVPDDYTDRPPNDMASVRTNLKLLKLLLDPKNESEFHIADFIAEAVEEIYKAVDTYLYEVDDILSSDWADNFFEDMGKNPEDCRLTMNKDATYLRKMKAMDTDIRTVLRDGKSESLVMTDVVPASGLIMARFHMIECELCTVVDLWDSSSVKEKPNLNIQQLPKMGSGYKFSNIFWISGENGFSTAPEKAFFNRIKKLANETEKGIRQENLGVNKKAQGFLGYSDLDDLADLKQPNLVESAEGGRVREGEGEGKKSDDGLPFSRISGYKSERETWNLQKEGRLDIRTHNGKTHPSYLLIYTHCVLIAKIKPDTDERLFISEIPLSKLSLTINLPALHAIGVPFPFRVENNEDPAFSPTFACTSDFEKIAWVQSLIIQMDEQKATTLKPELDISQSDAINCYFQEISFRMVTEITQKKKGKKAFYTGEHLAVWLRDNVLEFSSLSYAQLAIEGLVAHGYCLPIGKEKDISLTDKRAKYTFSPMIMLGAIATERSTISL